MSAPTERKTVQSRILAYAQEIGWRFVSRAEARRGFSLSHTPPALSHKGEREDAEREAASRHAAGGAVVCAILQTG